MSLVINTNVAALNSQRQLVKSGNDMAQAMERLSSGLKINHAKDDPAGMAISNKMQAQIDGLEKSCRCRHREFYSAAPPANPAALCR